MKALVQKTLTGPDGLAVEEVHIPAREDGLLIDVHVAGVGFPDLLLAKGAYQSPLPPPFVPGYELAGTIREAPADSPWTTGQRVLAFPDRGGHAEVVAVDPAMTLALPDEISFAEAVRLGTNYQTAYLAVAMRGEAEAGETALVFGAGGGLGNALVDVAAALGLTVIATASTEAKRALATATGATHVLDADHEDLVGELRRLAPDGIDLVLDPVGGTALAAGVRVLAVEGRLIILGFASGEFGAVPANRLLIRDADARGVVWGATVRRRPELATTIWERILELLSQGLLTPPDGPSYSLEDGAQALRDIEQRRVIGKAIIEIA